MLVRRPKLVYLYFVGLAFVMLVLWMSFIPNWLTFVHVWKVEFFASIFLGFTMLAAFRSVTRDELELTFSRDEIRFVVLPISAFIAWSLLSAIWAPSWRSAVHHALVWSMYLTFYCVTRKLLERPGGYRKHLYVFSFALVLCSLPAIFGYVAIHIFGGANSLGIRFSRFGEQVAVLLPLVLVAVVRLRNRKFVAGVTVVSCLWLLVFASMSRAGMIMFVLAAVGSAALVVTSPKLRPHTLRFATVAGILVLSTLLLQSPSFLPTTNAVAPSTSRLGDTQGLSNSNDFRKLMTALSLEMIRHSPIIGIGADNFGFEVHRYREAYAAANPNDILLAQAESDIPERAHNEYLQIFAELGLVGMTIFAWFLVGIGVMGYRSLRNIRQIPPHATAAIVGLCTFLIGGLVTSYSFRLIQNGFVFFFVLAVASRLLLKPDVRQAVQDVRSRPLLPKIAIVSAALACLLLFTYSSIRVSSIILTERANQTLDPSEAYRLYDLAARVDPENPFARNYHGMRLLREQEFAAAVPHLAAAIDIGLTPSDSYSYLATVQTLSGDNRGAEETMRRAAVMYPRSPFVLARYGILQRENGNEEDSQVTLARSENLNAAASKTWQTMIDKGFRIASSKQAADELGLMSVMDLQPLPGINAVLTDRLIKFPEEQRFSLFRAVNAKPSESAPRFEKLQPPAARP